MQYVSIFPAALTILLCALACGCLSDMHRIPNDELLALSQRPPPERGRQVRVVQSTAGEAEPPTAPRVESNTTVVVGVAVVGSAGGGGWGQPSNLAAAKADESKFWLIAAGILALALAVNEGLRYDGWVEVNPMHPVHLFGPYGEYRWMPLAQIDPQTAAFTTKALIRPEEGPWRPLGRAPLNRVGFTYALQLGAAEIPSAAEKRLTTGNSVQPGFIGHIGFGYFPAPVVGILIDVGLAWRQNTFGNTVFDARNALELQFLPLSVGIFHAGVFGDLGFAVRLEDGATGRDLQSFYGEGGALLQLELTTRLALQGRLGLGYLFGQLIGEGTVGVAIY
jgi:hypothetical protein